MQAGLSNLAEYLKEIFWVAIRMIRCFTQPVLDAYSIFREDITSKVDHDFQLYLRLPGKSGELAMFLVKAVSLINVQQTDPRSLLALYASSKVGTRKNKILQFCKQYHAEIVTGFSTPEGILPNSSSRFERLQKELVILEETYAALYRKHSFSKVRAICLKLMLMLLLPTSPFYMLGKNVLTLSYHAIVLIFAVLEVLLATVADRYFIMKRYVFSLISSPSPQDVPSGELRWRTQALDAFKLRLRSGFFYLCSFFSLKIESMEKAGIDSSSYKDRLMALLFRLTPVGYGDELYNSFFKHYLSTHVQEAVLCSALRSPRVESPGRSYEERQKYSKNTFQLAEDCVEKINAFVKQSKVDARTKRAVENYGNALRDYLLLWYDNPEQSFPKKSDVVSCYLKNNPQSEIVNYIKRLEEITNACIQGCDSAIKVL